MPRYMLVCKVLDTQTGAVNDNLYQSIDHLRIVAEANAKVDEFSHGRKIVATGNFNIDGDKMEWHWVFADTGESAYIIDIKRYQVA